jgi:hypothetical protein
MAIMEVKEFNSIWTFSDFISSSSAEIGSSRVILDRLGKEHSHLQGPVDQRHRGRGQGQ